MISHFGIIGTIFLTRIEIESSKVRYVHLRCFFVLLTRFPCRRSKWFNNESSRSEPLESNPNDNKLKRFGFYPGVLFLNSLVSSQCRNNLQIVVLNPFKLGK
jgi:hypothetical protein